MGGHGGLNILPHKSWNVYGRENRFKVHQDEEKAAEAEKEKQKQQQAQDSEYRRQLLLRRARGGQGASTSQSDHAGGSHPCMVREQKQGDERSEGAAHVVEDSPNAGKGRKGNRGHKSAEAPTKNAPGHINFWELEEKGFFGSTKGNPEEEAARREARRKRGDPKTQTTDPKFDASFAFAHGLTGKVPWYKQAPRSPTSTCDDAKQQGNTERHVFVPPGELPWGAPAQSVRDTTAHARVDAEAGSTEKRRRRSSSEEGDDEEKKKKRHKSDRREAKRKSKGAKRERRRDHKKKTRKKRHRSNRGGSSDSSDDDARKRSRRDVGIEALRAERLKREAAAASQTRLLMHAVQGRRMK